MKPGRRDRFYAKQKFIRKVLGRLTVRDEHLEWAKERALEYVERGDLQQAFASMASDVQKNDLLSNHHMLHEGVRAFMASELETPEAMRAWIRGFL